MPSGLNIAVVIPCYRVKSHINDVLNNIGPEVNRIYVVDDACPESTGKMVVETNRDSRLKVLFHSQNQGVGGAVRTGYLQALMDGMDVIVKIDGDGQMDPNLILTIARPVLAGRADYSKGNRFSNLESMLKMPKVRLIGNAFLSLMTKFSSGYWSITDPTNGFTAIHRKALEAIDLQKIRTSYFFESDMLFRLNIANCVAVDIPMNSVYGQEKSNLKIHKVMLEFPRLHLVNFFKRLVYRYYLREWSVGSFELPIGFGLLGFGVVFAMQSYQLAVSIGSATTAGQAMASAVAVILGAQLLLSFLALDVQSEPRVPRQSL